MDRITRKILNYISDMEKKAKQMSYVSCKFHNLLLSFNPTYITTQSNIKAMIVFTGINGSITQISPLTTT